MADAQRKLQIVNNLLFIFGRFQDHNHIDVIRYYKIRSNDERYKPGQEETNKIDTIAGLYNDYLGTIGKSKLAENKIYVIFYIYIRHIIFKLYSVKDGLDPPSDRDPNMYNEANFNNELIKTYIQKFNTEFLTDNSKQIDVNADMYNNVKQQIKKFSEMFGILTKSQIL
jgi:hypothetical protein